MLMNRGVGRRLPRREVDVAARGGGRGAIGWVCVQITSTAEPKSGCRWLANNECVHCYGTPGDIAKSTLPGLPGFPFSSAGASIHLDADDLDAHPQRVLLVAPALAEVVVVVAAARVVEAQPQRLGVLRQLDL